MLMAQSWPGNVRQLENALERLINLVDINEIQPRHLVEWTDITGEKEKFRPYQEVFKVNMPNCTQWPTLKEIVGEVEKQVLLEVLKVYPSSRQAGKALGVSNTTILNKMKAYGICPD